MLHYCSAPYLRTRNLLKVVLAVYCALFQITFCGVRYVQKNTSC